MHGAPHEPPHSPEHGPPWGSCGGSKEKGGCEDIIAPAARLREWAGTATERATATMVRGAVPMRGGGRVWDGPGNGVGGDAGVRMAQPGSSFAFTFLVGFAVGVVVVAFGLVGARLWAKRDRAREWTRLEGGVKR